MHTDPSPLRTRRASRPCPTAPGTAAGAGVFGNRIIDGPSRVSAVASMTSTSGADEGAKTVMPGYREPEGHVEHAVVARAVVTGDAGPVEDQDDRQPVEPDVEVGLVEGPGEERRVDGDHRPHAAHGHARRRGDGVLLGDADVEEAFREARLEGEQAGRARASPR